MKNDEITKDVEYPDIYKTVGSEVYAVEEDYHEYNAEELALEVV